MSSIFAKKPLDMLIAESEDKGGTRLKRVLGPVGLTSLGVGAIIGTGIFVLIGEVAHQKAGPAVMLSFVVAGMACLFAALCYAEFASMVPVAGSAYTYAYATLGEVMAWIIGWDLVLEYAVGSATVAVGWSGYFQKLLKLFHVELPKAIADAPIQYMPDTGKIVGTAAYMNLPAFLITLIITVILVRGIQESVRFNAAMVAVKLLVVLFVIAVGAFYVDPRNWHPFAPKGWTGVSFFGHTIFGMEDEGHKPLGVIAGAATIFFAYIGFDSVSTQAEECKNPKRDLPIGIMASLILCTGLYIAVAAVLTGMVPTDKINEKAPVSYAFTDHGLWWADWIITIGALTGITSVLLVMMLSQPRVFLAMARDRLLPPGFFASVHPRYQTPWKSTILCGFAVALMSSLLPLGILAELVSIGTLFAFAIVCGAVLVMRRTNPGAERPFRAPLVPFVPIAGIAICLLLMFSLPWENWARLIGWLVLGLVIYFGYGRSRSVLGRHLGSNPAA